MALQISKERSFNFIGLPKVLQTKIAQFLPEKGLAKGSEVSKVFKQVVENDAPWLNVAKSMHLNPKGKNLKKTVEETIGKAVALILNSNNDDAFKKLWNESDRKNIQGLPNSFSQRKTIIEGYRNKVELNRQYGSKVLGQYMFKLIKHKATTQEIEAIKILLKSGIFHPALNKLLFASGQIDSEIFDAYIEGKKRFWGNLCTDLFKDEVKLAIENFCPIFLKKLLEHDQCQTLSDIAQVIYYLSTAKATQAAAAIEMWTLITAKYRYDPESLKVFQEARAQCNAYKFQGGTVQLEMIINFFNTRLRKK